MSIFRVTLVSRNSDSAGQRFCVDHEKFLIGRQDECDLRLKSTTVSRRHCLIRTKPQGIFVRDLGSRHGTIVNGQRLTGGQQKQLWHRDTLQIGRLVFRVSFRNTKTNAGITPDSIDDIAAGRSAAADKSASARLPSTGMSSPSSGSFADDSVSGLTRSNDSTFEFLADPRGASELLNELDSIAASLHAKDDANGGTRSDKIQSCFDRVDSSLIEPDTTLDRQAASQT